MTNVVQFPNANVARSNMVCAWWISREQERAKAHAEHCRRMFNEEPGYDFVDPLPREKERNRLLADLEAENEALAQENTAMAKELGR